MSRCPPYAPVTRPDPQDIERRASAIAKLLALGPLTKDEIVKICGKWDMDTTLHAINKLLQQGGLTWRNGGNSEAQRVYMLPASEAVAA